MDSALSEEGRNVDLNSMAIGGQLRIVSHNSQGYIDSMEKSSLCRMRRVFGG